MNKFLYVVSDLVKTECRTTMLLENKSISRLMTRAQHVEGYKLMIIKRPGQETMSILNKNWVVEIARSFRKVLQLQHLHQLVFHLPAQRVRKVRNQALRIREVFQAPEPTQLVRSVVRTIKTSVLQEMKDVLSVFSLVKG